MSSIAVSMPAGMASTSVKQRLNRIRGLDDHDRIDEALYHDFETEDAKKVRHVVLQLLGSCVTSTGSWALK